MIALSEYVQSEQDEYLVLYNSKRPHKSLELLTPVEYILRENKNCNMW
ncbi:IS3 family transposase [Escherichia coli]